MRILIAEDDAFSRRLLELTLRKWDYQPEIVSDGRAALEQLLRPESPRLAILDWMMPELDGAGVRRKVREARPEDPPYLLLLTARTCKDDVVEGLEAGADDYLTKPFDRAELRARVRVGVRMLELQEALADRVRQLQAALGQVKQLQGLIPICCYCKKVRDDRDFWQQVETYVTVHTDARFSHGICPECMDTVVKAELETFKLTLPSGRRPA
jgi:phosphoserine phosphatase RsbU/P